MKTRFNLNELVWMAKVDHYNGDTVEGILSGRAVKIWRGRITRIEVDDLRRREGAENSFVYNISADENDPTTKADSFYDMSKGIGRTRAAAIRGLAKVYTGYSKNSAAQAKAILTLIKESDVIAPVI